jgi:hypothetical protein
LRFADRFDDGGARFLDRLAHGLAVGPGGSLISMPPSRDARSPRPKPASLADRGAPKPAPDAPPVIAPGPMRNAAAVDLDVRRGCARRRGRSR